MFSLEVLDVVKEYVNHKALDGVSLKVPHGSVYGLLGPNGAGKTSLIRIINQIITVDKGVVMFNGKEMTKQDVFRIGYLPEERGLYKKMKVCDQALFLSKLKGLSTKEATTQLDYWFEKLDLNKWKNKKIEELSKGMQQKVQFITAVVHDPDLLILDEPFSGFDPINAGMLKNEILELKSKGKTIILSTHNMESVEELCDEITLLNKSKVVLQGRVVDIKDRFKKNILRVVSVNDVRGLSVSANYTLLSSDKNDKGLFVMRFRKNENSSNSDIIKELANSYELVSVEEEFPSMNDIFIQVARQ